MNDSTPTRGVGNFASDLGNRGVVEGSVAPGYEMVAREFVANFTSRGDTGATLCIYRHGIPVVDLWGGWSNPKNKVPYTGDTLQLVFSTTKGLATACMLRLVQQGKIELDTPVSKVWPEFAAAGKATVPLRWLLSHKAGLPTIDIRLKLDDVLAWTPVVDALAAQTPYWEPGSAHGYHALTYGWLIGEVVRRVSGRSLGRFFADEIAGPLGLDTWIGLPEEHEHRVAPLRMRALPSAADLHSHSRNVLFTMLKPDSLLLRALTLNGAFGMALGRKSGPFNSQALHSAEIPAANAITNARSLALMYAAMIGEVNGIRILSDSTIKQASAVESTGPDRVLVVPTTFGLGFMCHSNFAPMLGEGSFGHPGLGGSLAFANPQNGISFAYVMNQLRLGLAGDERTTRLIDALNVCVS